MMPRRKLFTQEWFVLICFVVLGFAILPGLASAVFAQTGPLSFGETLGAYYRGLFDGPGNVGFAVALAIGLGPYLVYLLVRATMWMVRFLVVFVIHVIPRPETDPPKGS